MPKFELIQGGKDKDAPVLRDVSKGKKRLESIGGGMPLRDTRPRSHHEIAAAWEMGEDPAFSKAEIIEHIQKIAKKDGFDKNLLEVEGETYDTGQNLVYLKMRIKEARAKFGGWHEISYHYTLKGTEMDSRVLWQPETAITSVFESNIPGETEVASREQYKNGKWISRAKNDDKNPS